MSEQREPGQTDQGLSGVQLLSSSDGGAVLRLTHGEHRIQRILSQNETWDLLGLVGGVIKQASRIHGDDEKDPIEHTSILTVPAMGVSVGTNDAGLPVIGVSSSSFPTIHVPLDLGQAKHLVDILSQIIEWSEGRGRRN